MAKCTCLYYLVLYTRNDDEFLSSSDLKNIRARLKDPKIVLDENEKFLAGSDERKIYEQLIGDAELAFNNIENESAYNKSGARFLNSKGNYHDCCITAVQTMDRVRNYFKAISRNIFDFFGYTNLTIRNMSQSAKELYRIDQSIVLDMYRLVGASLWIRDSTINHYFRLLCERNEYVGRIDSLAFAERTDYGTRDYIKKKRAEREAEFSHSFDANSRIVLAPVSEDNTHWYLMVANIDTKTITVYDSLGVTSLTGAKRNAYARIKRILGSKLSKSIRWKIKCVGEPEQEDGSSCGVFTMATGEYLSRQAPIDYCQAHIYSFRLQIFEQICRRRAAAKLEPKKMELIEFNATMKTLAEKLFMCPNYLSTLNQSSSPHNAIVQESPSTANDEKLVNGISRSCNSPTVQLDQADTNPYESSPLLPPTIAQQQTTEAISVSSTTTTTTSQSRDCCIASVKDSVASEFSIDAVPRNGLDFDRILALSASHKDQRKFNKLLSVKPLLSDQKPTAKDQILIYEANTLCIVILYLHEQKQAYVADGCNRVYHDPELKRNMKEIIGVNNLYPLRFYRQRYINETGSSGAALINEFKRLYQRMDMLSYFTRDDIIRVEARQLNDIRKCANEIEKGDGPVKQKLPSATSFVVMLGPKRKRES